MYICWWGVTGGSLCVCLRSFQSVWEKISSTVLVEELSIKSNVSLLKILTLHFGGTYGDGEWKECKLEIYHGEALMVNRWSCIINIKAKCRMFKSLLTRNPIALKFSHDYLQSMLGSFMNTLTLGQLSIKMFPLRGVHLHQPYCHMRWFGKIILKTNPPYDIPDNLGHHIIP